MDNRSDVRRMGLILAAILTVSLPVVAADAPATALIHDDAVLSGAKITRFQGARESGWVVRGDFLLELGDRRISGRDAVVWDRKYAAGQAERHDITVYIEGGAKIDEPGGLSTTDKTFLTVFRIEGSVTTRPEATAGDVTGIPLFKRAEGVRGQSVAREAKLAESRKTGRPLHAPPTLVRKKVDRPQDLKAEDVKSTRLPSSPRTAKAADTPAPVHFHARKFESTLKTDSGRRITIARGKVYVAQGSSDSDSFLELRSDDAVIISRPLKDGETPPKKVSRAPLSPKTSDSAREIIVGVYLEGNVVVSRGARTLKGDSAFYDFIADRAIIPNAVLKTVQGQRDVPVYIRAKEIRMLSAREMVFKDAMVTTSDFAPTPTYHIGATRAYMMDTAPYGQDGQRLGEQRWLTKLENTTYSVRGVKLLWWPYLRTEVEQGHTALRKAMIGLDSSKGLGVETEWHLFRLLGLVRPEGVEATFHLNLYQREPLAGVDWEYERGTYTGYGVVAGGINRDQQDDFGDERKDEETRKQRGRILLRHKHVLPDDWQAQFELSYACDKNFIEANFSDEFHAGKEQETLLYARKQRDNWVLTSLLQTRLNRFDTQTESYPDVGFHLIGQPLAQDRLTYYTETHAGVKRYRTANFLHQDDSDFMLRLDTRHEIDMPMQAGPINVTPYVTGRFSYWSDEPTGGENVRPMVTGGVKVNTRIWAVHNNVKSRFWDVNGVRHEIVPEVVGFLGTAGGVQPSDLYPMDPDIEEHLSDMSGFSFAIHNLWQTKRGGGKGRPPEVVDWMRFSMVASIFATDAPQVPSDGRFFFYRPENSMARNHINFDYEWVISDSTTFMADMNIDLDDGRIGRSGMALAVSRDPRLKYVFGLRTIDDLDSIVGTFGMSYRISRKYTISFLEQYDFGSESENLITQVTLVRKLPRWYTAFTVQFDQRQDNLSLLVTFWPEGIPEAEIRSGRLNILSSSSSKDK